MTGHSAHFMPSRKMSLVVVLFKPKLACANEQQISPFVETLQAESQAWRISATRRNAENTRKINFMKRGDIYMNGTITFYICV
jgi:hypothetical protein